MQHLEVSCVVRRFFKSLGFKGLSDAYLYMQEGEIFIISLPVWYISGYQVITALLMETASSAKRKSLT